MKNRNYVNHDNWQTPPGVIKKLEEEFGFIDFDPCPLNASFDGLEVEWGHKNFINPPYSMRRVMFNGAMTPLKEAFIKKAYEESKKGKLCIMLLPVSTSTKIFHEIVYRYGEVRFIQGRLKFRGYNTKGIFVENKPGQMDSMIVIFRPRNPDGSFVKQGC